MQSKNPLTQDTDNDDVLDADVLGWGASQAAYVARPRFGGALEDGKALRFDFPVTVNLDIGGLSLPSLPNISIDLSLPDPNLPEFDLPENILPAFGLPGVNPFNIDIDIDLDGFGDLLNFQDGFSLSNIIEGLRFVVDFLDGIEGLDFLDFELPIIDLSLSDMLAFALDFGDFVVELEASGASSLQIVEEVLEDLLGFDDFAVAGGPALADTAIFPIAALNTGAAAAFNVVPVELDTDLADLNDGDGIATTVDGSDDFTITLLGGALVLDFDSADANFSTVGDLITAINDAATAAGVALLARVNDNKNGLALEDTSTAAGSDNDGDASNDTITFTGHTYVTGQSVVYDNGGGAGTDIAGLTSATEYFVIADDVHGLGANFIQLAASAVDAEAGTAIDLTAVGTGTAHTLTGTFAVVEESVQVAATQLGIEGSDDDADGVISGDALYVPTFFDQTLHLLQFQQDDPRVELSIDASDGFALRLDLEFNTSVSDQFPLDLDLVQFIEDSLNLPFEFPDLVDISGSAMMSLEAGAGIAVSLGLDLTDITSGNIRPFLYDFDDGGTATDTSDDSGTRITLEAGIEGQDLEFDLAIGPLGVFVRDGSVGIIGNDPTDAAFDPTADHDPASIIISLTDNNGDGRHFIADLFGDDEEGIPTPDLLDLVGFDFNLFAFADLPLDFPLEGQALDANQHSVELSVDVEQFVRDVVIDGKSLSQSTAFEITLPDFSAALDNLGDLRNNLFGMVGGWEGVFDLIIDALDGNVLGFDIPLIGDALAEQVDFLEDLRDSVVDNFAFLLGSQNDSNEGKDPEDQDNFFSLENVRQPIFDALGPGGIDFLLDLNEDNTTLGELFDKKNTIDKILGAELLVAADLNLHLGPRTSDGDHPEQQRPQLGAGRGRLEPGGTVTTEVGTEITLEGMVVRLVDDPSITNAGADFEIRLRCRQQHHHRAAHPRRGQQDHRGFGGQGVQEERHRGRWQ